jgi:hypothetical protein
VLLSAVVGHTDLAVIMADITTDLAPAGLVLRVDLVLAEGTLLVLVRLEFKGFELVRVGKLLLQLNSQLALCTCECMCVGT